MSMTAVPISTLLVRAPMAARSGNGEPSWRAKWCTRKYAPSTPSLSAATASSIDCRRASDAVRTSEYGDGVQCPKDRKPIFFTHGYLREKVETFCYACRPVQDSLSKRETRRQSGRHVPTRTLYDTAGSYSLHASARRAPGASVGRVSCA